MNGPHQMGLEGRSPEDRHFEGLISLGGIRLEVGAEREKWVSGYLKMSHQEDWNNAGVTERLMENGRKDHTQSFGRKLQWLQRPGRCKVGTTGRGGFETGQLISLNRVVVHGGWYSLASEVLAMWECIFDVTRSSVSSGEARNPDLICEKY